MKDLVGGVQLVMNLVNLQIVNNSPQMWSIIVSIWHLLLISFYKFIERNGDFSSLVDFFL